MNIVTGSSTFNHLIMDIDRLKCIFKHVSKEAFYEISYSTNTVSIISDFGQEYLSLITPSYVLMLYIHSICKPSISIIQELVDVQTNLHTRNKRFRGYTTLLYAFARRLPLPYLQCLVELGANLTDLDSNMNNILHIYLSPSKLEEKPKCYHDNCEYEYEYEEEPSAEVVEWILSDKSIANFSLLNNDHSFDNNNDQLEQATSDRYTSKSENKFYEYNTVQSQSKIDINAISSEGYNCLMFYLMGQRVSVDVIRVLLENGVDVNFTQRYSRETALYLSIVKFPIDILEILLDYGAIKTFNHNYVSGCSILHIVSSLGDQLKLDMVLKTLYNYF